ncbi:MAG: ribonuclease PH [Alphaproteobacteria bacterium]
MTRLHHRPADQLREVVFVPHFTPFAEGSCLINMGHTHVLCNVTVEERVPPFLKGTGKGWITAEYGMLPRSTHTRTEREAAKGKVSGRTMEIQRLIGRSLRSVCDLSLLGERQIRLDCDVIQADGGTRCAAITGGFVALHFALQGMVQAGKIKTMPLSESLAAVSCGICEDQPLLDLDYAEDSTAHADANFVMTDSGKVIEVQCTAEAAPLDWFHFEALYQLARGGLSVLLEKQKEALLVCRPKP